MTKLIEKQESYKFIKWGDMFVFALIGSLIIAATTSHVSALPQQLPPVVSVPAPQVIEKEVVDTVPVRLNAHDERQIQCLAENAYFEAGNQSTRGKIAVTNVVMNRTRDNRFPPTPCGVVKQKARGVCQFSWVCEGKKRIRDSALFNRSRQIAEEVYLRNIGDVTHGAKFYHADYVRPRWASAFDRTTKIGAHIFYRG